MSRDTTMPTRPQRSAPGWSVRQRLILLALAVAVPFMLLNAAIIRQLAESEREARRQSILLSARALMNAADALIEKHIAIAQTLAASPALQADDDAAFRRDASRALPALGGAWVVLADETGQQRVNLLRESDTALPRRHPDAFALQRRAHETGRPQVSGVFPGAALGAPIVSVEVAVPRDGKPPLGLAVIMQPKTFQPLIAEAMLPPGWLAGIVDRSGSFVARSRDHDSNVGRKASAGFQAVARAAPEGFHEFPSLEGEPVANAHVTSRLSGWVLGLAAPVSLFEAPVRRIAIAASLWGLAATLLSLALAFWASGRIAAPIEQLGRGTHSLSERRALAFERTGVPEVDRVLQVLATTSKTLIEHDRERDRHERHTHLIMRELSHRAKNLLSIILAMARQTGRESASLAEFQDSFAARVQSLAAAHDLLVSEGWSGASLRQIVQAQLAPFAHAQVEIAGPDVFVAPEAVQNLGLALHELATNATKHGALSVEGGKVRLAWAFHRAGESRSLRLTWTERGGPAVREPARHGFGRTVLERVAILALGGKGSLDFTTSGVVWTCEIDQRFIVDDAADASPARAHDTSSAAPDRRAP